MHLCSLNAMHTCRSLGVNDRELNDSNNYVTKLTMLSTLLFICFSFYHCNDEGYIFDDVVH